MFTKVTDWTEESRSSADRHAPAGGGGQLVVVADGEPQGLALQLLDVKDPTAPTVVAEHVFPDAVYTSAVGDTRALGFFPERDLLAFPVTDERYFISLELFEFSALAHPAGQRGTGGTSAGAGRMPRPLWLSYRSRLCRHHRGRPAPLAPVRTQCDLIFTARK